MVSAAADPTEPTTRASTREPLLIVKDRPPQSRARTQSHVAVRSKPRLAIRQVAIIPKQYVALCRVAGCRRGTRARGTFVGLRRGLAGLGRLRILIRDAAAAFLAVLQFLADALKARCAAAAGTLNRALCQRVAVFLLFVVLRVGPGDEKEGTEEEGERERAS